MPWFSRNFLTTRKAWRNVSWLLEVINESWTNDSFALIITLLQRDINIELIDSKNFVIHTCMFKELGVLLWFALVSASGCLHLCTKDFTKPLSGTLTPTKDVPGFSNGFNFSERSNTTVTGPGRSECRRSLEIVTSHHLIRKMSSIIY